nr:conserved hypothetical membrane protein, oligosaccharyl transferase STT3 subunit family [uncultured archaeon]
MKRIEKASLICGLTLVLLFCLSLYIRVAIPYNIVFNDTFVRFGGYDPWYNIRLVENTLHHFPHRIYFDPFTAYPQGTYNPFGTPLFDLSLAFIVWAVGLGNPFAILTRSMIEEIWAWYPAVLAALTIFPVYFIGKGLYNRGAGLLSAALIAILPGQFLIRSLLGFTDHHAMETLFSTIAMLFLILALKSARENGITFQSFLGGDRGSLKKPIVYSIISGVFLGSYFLAWLGAPLFILILCTYAVVQHVADHLREKDTDYLCIVCVPVFIVPLAMIAPALSFGFLSEIHKWSLLLAIFVPPVLTALSLLIRKAKIKPYWYPIVILAVAIASFIVLFVFKPALYSTITWPLLHIFSPSKQYLTIIEVRPMEWANIWAWFTTTFFLAFVALAWIGYNIWRKWRAEEILLFVWCAIMLFACFGQGRFSMYYAINVAILCGFLSWEIIELVAFRGAEKGVRDMKESKGPLEEKREDTIKGKRRRKTIKTQKSNEIKNKKFLRVDVILTFIVILIVVFFFPLNEALTTAKLGCGGPREDWYESLSWMRGNTPDTGVDFYALYPRDYAYPDSAYSVMSWWDYGNWITYIAHRIPVANNFQQGIGGPNSPGAAIFFIAKNESVANEVADAFDVRYVVSAFPMVDTMASYQDLYGAMTFWADDTTGRYTLEQTEGRSLFKLREEYYKSMVTKLHMFDGRETQFKGGYLGKSSILVIRPFQTKPLQHYRLVHESSTYMVPHAILNVKTDDVQAWECYVGSNYTMAERLAYELRHGFTDPEYPDLARWTPPFVSPMSFVKVFEYVKGAKIEARAPSGAIVEIATNITTNQGREFMYSQIAMPNGTYEFVVPYSTEGPIEREGYTNFDVLAVPYTIRRGHIENETIIWDTRQVVVEITEEEVMEGKTVTVDLV